MSKMKKLELSVKKIIQETPSVKTIQFDLQDQEFEFQAGQYIIMQLENEDPKERNRSFTLSNSPTEKGFIQITTKISQSAFKQKLNSLKKGDKIKVIGPLGEFLLHKNEHNHVMIAGGIGITPFRSMIKNSYDMQSQKKIILLYSNKVPEEIVFRKEFEEMQKQNSNLKVVNFITRPKESQEKWKGETGRINAELIKKFIPELENSIFYVCGPPKMVQSMKQILSKELSIQKEKIEIEEFTGY